MQTYNITVCGLEISFKTSVEAQRVYKAAKLIEENYENLQFHGNQLSKEKLMLVLAIGIADDFLQIQEEQQKMLQAAEGKNSQDELINERLTRLLDIVNSVEAK